MAHDSLLFRRACDRFRALLYYTADGTVPEPVAPSSCFRILTCSLRFSPSTTSKTTACHGHNVPSLLQGSWVSFPPIGGSHRFRLPPPYYFFLRCPLTHAYHLHTACSISSLVRAISVYSDPTRMWGLQRYMLHCVTALGTLI